MITPPKTVTPKEEFANYILDGIAALESMRCTYCGGVNQHYLNCKGRG